MEVDERIHVNMERYKMSPSSLKEIIENINIQLDNMGIVIECQIKETNSKKINKNIEHLLSQIRDVRFYLKDIIHMLKVVQ